jgi:hypothetical protein
MRYRQTTMEDGSKPIRSLRCLREVIEAIAWERIETRIAALENQLLRGSSPID